MPGTERVFDFLPSVFQMRPSLISLALGLQLGIVGCAPQCRLSLAPELLNFIPGFIGAAHRTLLPFCFRREALTKRLPVFVTDPSPNRSHAALPRRGLCPNRAHAWVCSSGLRLSSSHASHGWWLKAPLFVAKVRVVVGLYLGRSHLCFVVERVDQLAGCCGGALLVLAAGLRVDSGNYGWVTGMKPDGVVAVTVGLAALVSGAAGGVVVVIVCSVA